MYQIGIDIGSSTIKIVVMKEKHIQKLWSKPHQGMILDILWKGLLEQSIPAAFSLSITGCNAQLLFENSKLSLNAQMDEIPAIIEGVKYAYPSAECIIEIGSQNSRFITSLSENVPRFSVNEHCAGGTGSFFEDQMSRLGLCIDDYSQLVKEARSIPRLSGRCAVFAKTDIIHRQQEGVSTPDILLGLCYAMIRNYKANIVRDLPVCRPIIFSGGVTNNHGVRRAIMDIFNLSEGELIIPEHAVFSAAIGAASHAHTVVTDTLLFDVIRSAVQEKMNPLCTPFLNAPPFSLKDPQGSGKIPSDGCALGIDVGSTSTDLVLIGRDGTLIDFQYLRTAGNPEKVVREGLSNIQKRFGNIKFLAVGVTGSGRERIGRLIGADAVRDEITAQARSAVQLVPEADTVFEIGGQDSKFISLHNGIVSDFQMNKICAAGTGSFVEEQASRMGIAIENLGPLALTAQAPAELGERCTVFIETAITSALASGSSPADIAAGLCHAIVRNYLHKVVSSKPVGQRIVLQGGVAYNPGIVAAFHHIYKDRLTVSPYFSISGAYGAALLALEAVKDGSSQFRGFDFTDKPLREAENTKMIQKNTLFYQKAGQMLLEGYDPTRSPEKKTIGVPYVLLIHKFFPMINAFFKSLGFNVVLTDPTSEDTIRLSQQSAQGETCYPVKLIYGHMAQLIEQKVDYIFLPSVRTMKHETSRVKNNYGCVYMQTAARSIAQKLQIQEKGIHLLNPVFDLDFGKEAMATAMLSVGKALGFPEPLCKKALLDGAEAVRRHTEQVEKQGQALLASLKADEKVFVLITRNYGISDPILNMGIPKLLLERGHKLITLSHLPAHDLDISASYPNLYWPFGQHILSGIKMVARHPNLYAVYLTNHGCGPDSMLSHMVQKEMGEKPYLQIEVDEHFSKVGVITRMEAFLNSLSHRPTQPLAPDFDIKHVCFKETAIRTVPRNDIPVYIPDFGLYTPYLAEYMRKTYHVETHVMDKIDLHHLEFGRAETNTKEYLPFTALLDSVLRLSENKEPAQVLIPFNEGAEADGQYAQAIQAVLDKRGIKHIYLFSPILEEIPSKASNFDLLTRALFTGDLLYAVSPAQRMSFMPSRILSWDRLINLAEQISSLPNHGQRLAAVGTPMSLTSLDHDILDTLAQHSYHIVRMPLSEYLWFLWNDSAHHSEDDPLLNEMKQRMYELSFALGNHSGFSKNLDPLILDADQALPRFAGGNGRYRWAKAIAMSHQSYAVLTLSPRYENTAAVLNMLNLSDACQAPVFEISLDGDWDTASWSRLRSFLYYC